MSIIRGGSDPPMPGDGAGRSREPAPTSDSLRTSSTKTYTLPAEGVQTLAEAKTWVGMQIPYPNRANDEQVRSRALGLVREFLRNWEATTADIRDVWRATQYELRGSVLPARRGLDETYVPELYKQVESIIPRIEEALLAQDPWFAVVGKKPLRETDAAKIRDFLRAQLSADMFDHKIQPALRTAFSYGLCAFKGTWEIEFDERIRRDVERTVGDDGKSHYTVKRTREKTVIWNGPRWRLVDPLDLICDPKSWLPPHDALWIGDQRWMTYEDIVACGKLGLFTNVDQVQADTASTGPSLSEHDKLSRSLSTFGTDDAPAIHQSGAPSKHRVIEVWCKFDPDGDGNAVEHVITVVDERVVVRVQENFHDDKHKPYALCRLAREPFELLAVPPLAHAVQVSQEIHEHRALVLKGHRDHLAPKVFLPETEDVPDNIFESGPGAVFQSATPPTMVQTPSTLGEYAGMFSIQRRDIEEILGVPRLYEPTGTSVTATEIERKVQEGNRRLRSYVLSFSFMLAEILKQTHALNQQWVDRATVYRVLGRGGRGLEQYTEIGPDVLAHEVEFEFRGLASLATLGLRATQLSTFLNIVYPYLSIVGDQVNIPELIRELYELQVGLSASERIVRPRGEAEDLMDQEDENILLLQGEKVPVQPGDRDADHLSKMTPLLAQAKAGELDSLARKVVLMHAAEHAFAMRQKKVAAAANSNGSEGIAIDKDRGTTGRRHGMDLGGEGAMQRPGQTPGPDRAGAVAAGDRPGAITQTANTL